MNKGNKIQRQVRKTAFLLCTLLLAIPALAQTQFKQQAGTGVFTVFGTSTLHEWEMVSKEGAYQATFKLNTDGTPAQLSALTVSIPAESLKSGKGAMDKNAYTSLKTDQFKSIAFTLTTAKVEGEKIKCTGNLTVAGTTKPMDLEATCKLAGGLVVCKGTKSFKMTEFKVEPPTFMFGSIKTGDEIKVAFEVSLAAAK